VRRTASELRHSGWNAGLPAWVRVGDLIFVTGQMAIDDRDKVLAVGDVERQTQIALEALGDVLAAADATTEDIVAVASYHLDARQIDQVMGVVAKAHLATQMPAWTPVMMTGAPVVGAEVMLSAIAVANGAEKVSTVPDTIAWWRALPVAAGCRKGDVIVVSGQYGSDADGNVNTPGDPAGQARNALNRVREICTLLGGNLDDVIDVVSFHQDPRGIAPATCVYDGEFFTAADSAARPSWTTAATPGLYRHGMLIQIQAMADRRRASARGGTGGTATTAESPTAGTPSLITIAVEPPPSVAGQGPAAQAQAAWRSLEEELGRRGAGIESLVALTSYHKDIRDLTVLREVIVSRCDTTPLSWTPVGMTGFRNEHSLHAFHAVALAPSAQD
jgi:enamine deaminase RidA (YjgF/YER057c/UK114 family)